MDHEIAWRIVYLSISSGMVAAAIYLWPNVPNGMPGSWMLQKIVLTLVIVSGFIYGMADIIGMWSPETKVWPIKVIASRIEHFAMAVYLVRQIWIDSPLCKSLRLFQQHRR